MFLMADPRNQAIASRLVKEIAMLAATFRIHRRLMSPNVSSNAAKSAGARRLMARDPENTLIMDLKSGPVVIELKPDVAPEPCRAHQGTDAARFL